MDTTLRPHVAPNRLRATLTPTPEHMDPRLAWALRRKELEVAFLRQYSLTPVPPSLSCAGQLGLTGLIGGQVLVPRFVLTTPDFEVGPFYEQLCSLVSAPALPLLTWYVQASRRADGLAPCEVAMLDPQAFWNLALALEASSAS